MSKYGVVDYTSLLEDLIKEKMVDKKEMRKVERCLFYPIFSPISWYPIGSYSFVSSLQLPYGLRRGVNKQRPIQGYGKNVLEYGGFS
jgi:hypothetical protein